MLSIIFVSFSMESQLVACNFNSCSYKGTIDQVKNHYLWRHCTIKTVPYICKVCWYRARSRGEMRLHRRVRHQIRKRQEDLRKVCYGTFKRLSYLHVAKGQVEGVKYDNIPRQELISNDNELLATVREAITNSCWEQLLPTQPSMKTPPWERRSLPTQPNMKKPSWERRSSKELVMQITKFVPRQVQTCYQGRRVQQFQQRQAQTYHFGERRFQQVKAQAHSTWGQSQTCEVHKMPTVAFRAKEQLSTHHNLSSGHLLPIRNSNTNSKPWSGIQTKEKHSTDALQSKTLQNKVSSTITRPTKNDITSDDDELAEPEALPQHVTRLLALEDDDMVADEADELIAEKADEMITEVDTTAQHVTRLLALEDDDMVADKADELIAEKADEMITGVDTTAQHVTRLLALEEDDIMADQADELITEVDTMETQSEASSKSTMETHTETSSQSEINNTINQGEPDEDLVINVTSTMQELGLAGQEKQDQPIINRDKEVMAGNSKLESPDEDLDDNPAEASTSNEETMSLISGLKAKMKKTSVSKQQLPGTSNQQLPGTSNQQLPVSKQQLPGSSNQQLPGEMQQLRDELQMLRDTKATNKMAVSMQALKATIDKLIPLMERQIPLMEAQITWTQQMFGLLDKQMKMQQAVIQAQQVTLDKYSDPAGDRQ